VAAKQEILDHLAELIQDGQRVNSSYRMTDHGSLESDLPEADFRSFAASTYAAIERITGRNSEYYRSLPPFDSTDPLNIPGYNNTKVPTMLGALAALQNAVNKGCSSALRAGFGPTSTTIFFNNQKSFWIPSFMSRQWC
jgi:hypothetical protein